ncbi:MAG TPA: nuclear transport factor 2 family protein [Gaiellaceae bacterium]|nr:nuclear transport factor 2 family protein [Gaiellaceae bacterium]
MSVQQNSAAVAAARAFVEAWDRHDLDAVRAALSDDVWMTMVAADPSFPRTELNGLDAYMEGLLESKDAVVPGSTEVVEAAGDATQALLRVNAKVRFGRDAPEMDARSARMYVLDGDGKITIEHVIFFLS